MAEPDITPSSERKEKRKRSILAAQSTVSPPTKRAKTGKMAKKSRRASAGAEGVEMLSNGSGQAIAGAQSTKVSTTPTKLSKRGVEPDVDIAMQDAQPASATKKAKKEKRASLSAERIVADVDIASEGAAPELRTMGPSVNGSDVNGESLTVNKTGSKRKNQTQPADDSARAVAVTLRRSSTSMSQEQKREKIPLWDVSKPTAGCFLRVDPIFSSDEKYLILSTSRNVEIYSAETSLLVRRIAVSSLYTITSVVLSKETPDRIYIATLSGVIFSANWQTGSIEQQWTTPNSIAQMTCILLENAANDILITSSNVATEGYALRYHQVPDSWKTTEMETKVIEHPQQPIHTLYALPGGQAMFGASGSDLLVFTPEPFKDPSKQAKAHFACRKVQCSEPIVSISALSSDKTKAIDLALGGIRGHIFVYADIMGQLTGSTSGRSVNASLTPRQLRGHKSPVEAIKWSRDGNYIISGGHEASLTISQLETGRAQTLRALTSPILSITISPTGKSYGLRLADNAVMTLSTAELTPRAYISGIQSRVLRDERSPRPIPVTATLMAETKEEHAIRYPRTQLLVDPKSSTQLMLTVPTHQADDLSARIPPAPFLQTFDTFSGRHVRRQALARNNVTAKDIGPNSIKLKEADVRLLQISADGTWLATVEEWVPPLDDVDLLADTEHDVSERRQARRETALKFWQRANENAEWTLVTIVPAPHQADAKPSANRVLDLTASPSGTTFATIGEDAIIRTWHPKSRFSKDLVQSGDKATTEQQIIWRCIMGIELERPIIRSDRVEEALNSPPLTSAKLSYSDDASILAAALEVHDSKTNGLIHLIHISTGEIIQTLPDIIRDGLAGLTFISSRYLVALSRSLQVWDLITNTLVYGFSLNIPAPLRSARFSTLKHLVANRSGGYFAVALPALHHEKQKSLTGENIYSTVMVFTPENAYPLLTTELPTIVQALAPIEGTSNFVVLDAKAELRTVGLKSDMRSLETLLQSTEALNTEGNSNIALFGAVDEDVDMLEQVDGEDLVEDEEEEDNDMVVDDDDTDKPVVRQGQLAAVLNNGPAFALPNVRELFDAVLELYARKPRAVGKTV